MRQDKVACQPGHTAGAALTSLRISKQSAPRSGISPYSPKMTEPSHFVFLLMPQFSHLAFCCAVEPLRLANLVSGKTLFRWTVASEDGRPVMASNGCRLEVDTGLEPAHGAERLALITGNDVKRAIPSAVQAYLRRERAAGTPLAGLGAGAYGLAKCGFLNGMDVAVHWAYHDLFAEAFPEVRLVRSVFVAHEKILTAAGGTAVADLMLHMIRQKHGDELTTLVADQMVYNTVREESAAQRVSIQSRHGMRNSHVVRAISIMEKHIEDPISPGTIAKELGISTRQLERLFSKYLSSTPKGYFNGMRLERAQNLLVQTELSVTEVAIATGFVSPSHFCKVFRSHFGRSPHVHRATLN